MKKTRGRMKVLFLLALCASLVFPAIASAGQTTVFQGELTPGEYTIDRPLPNGTTSIVYTVVNGGTGGDRVSSAVVTEVDQEGNEVKDIFTQNNFSSSATNADKAGNPHEVSNLSFTDVVLSPRSSLVLKVKVNGKKTSRIQLTVKANFNGWVSPAAKTSSDWQVQ